MNETLYYNLHNVINLRSRENWKKRKMKMVWDVDNSGETLWKFEPFFETFL